MSEPPVLRVVRGHPDDAETAALAAVLLAAASRPGPAPAGGPRRGLWGDPATLLRSGTGPRPGGWAAPPA